MLLQLEGRTLKSAASDHENEDCIFTASSFNNSKINLFEISVLNLSNCNLNTLPKEFCALENLRVLNLSRNKLRGAPACLDKNLLFIQHLDLSYNSLKEFEREPACRVRLKTLLLNNNNLLNIPEWILYVRSFNLIELDYSYNEVNSLYASQFNVKSNYRLKKLTLQSCFVFEKDFEYINTIKTLQYLDVSNNKPQKRFTNVIKGERIFARPFFAQTLTVLKMNYLELSVLSPDISCLVNLRELYLTCNALSWLPDTVTDLCCLEVLDVSENSICYLPADFQKLTHLKKLIAHSNSLSSLPDTLPPIVHLDVYNNTLYDFSFAITTFTHLDLEFNYVKTPELPQYDDYLKKRKNLRSTLECPSRNDCAKTLNESGQNSYSDSSSIISECSSGDELEPVNQLDFVEDWWDRQPASCNYVRVCTESDDEWTGSEPRVVPKEKNNYRGRVSPYFSDAD